MEGKCFTWRLRSKGLIILVLTVLLAMPDWIGAVRGPRHQREPRRQYATVSSSSLGDSEFVKTSGHQFSLGGKALYVNGANMYWLMSMAAEEGSRAAVTEVLTSEFFCGYISPTC